MEYFSDFITIAVVHLLAVVSPGPDFALVVRQSVVFGRKTALWTSVGIGSGIIVHVTFCLLGIGLLISQSVLLFDILKYIAAVYLLYIGYLSLKSRPAQADKFVNGSEARASQSPRKALMVGFLTNVVGNPKAILFFLFVFSAVIRPGTPILIQAGFGLWMVLATAAWFMCLSLFLTQKAVLSYLYKYAHWVERLMGAVLVALAVKIALASLE